VSSLHRKFDPLTSDRHGGHWIGALLRAPLDDYLRALESIVPAVGWRGLFLALAAASLSWWIYVPIHELLHALGCLVAGGSVTRLEIDAVYGAAYMQKVLPFVAVGSDYAGQLTGFDTGGSDVVYLATDFAPFVLTIVVGVPGLRAVGSLRKPIWRAIALGAAIPVAYAPFISLPGDYYEMGSIVVSRVAATFGYTALQRWRSDDVFRLVETLASGDGTAFDWAAIVAAALLGCGLAWATYGVGILWNSTLQATLVQRANESGSAG